jgi:serine/threonine protein kinase
VRSGVVLAGRYRLDDLLGRGGMGEVWRGWDSRLNRPVAIKVVLPERDTDPQLVLRLLREAENAAAIDHPGITVVHDVGEQDGAPFLVMEFLEGEDLKRVLDRCRAGLPVEDVVSVARQAADALAAAHTRGVVHRDIKPANLMLLADGRVKICDFGISRLAEATTGLTAGNTMGTPSYMAPEQFQGKRSDARTDLYSLGCTLYALLTGRPPFAAESLPALMYQHLNGDPARPSTLRPDIPAPLEQLVLELVARSPGHRPASAHAVSRRLHDPALLHTHTPGSAGGGPARKLRQEPAIATTPEAAQPPAEAAQPETRSPGPDIVKSRPPAKTPSGGAVSNDAAGHPGGAEGHDGAAPALEDVAGSGPAPVPGHRTQRSRRGATVLAVAAVLAGSAGAVYLVWPGPSRPAAAAPKPSSFQPAAAAPKRSASHPAAAQSRPAASNGGQATSPGRQIIFTTNPPPCSTPPQATTARLVPGGKVAERFNGLTMDTCTYLSSVPPFPSLRVETRFFPASPGLGDPIQQARDWFAAGLNQARKGDGVTTTLSLRQQSGIGDQAYLWLKTDNNATNLVGEVFVQLRNAIVVIDYSQDQPIQGADAATRQKLLDEATAVARQELSAFS